MAYHTKKRRTRARKHTLRSRRRTRGGGKRKRVFPEDKLKSLLMDLQGHTRSPKAPVEFTEKDKDVYRYIYEDYKDNKEAIIDAIHKYKLEIDEEYSKWLIDQFFEIYKRNEDERKKMKETKNER